MKMQMDFMLLITSLLLGLALGRATGSAPLGLGNGSTRPSVPSLEGEGKRSDGSAGGRRGCWLLVQPAENKQGLPEVVRAALLRCCWSERRGHGFGGHGHESKARQ